MLLSLKHLIFILLFTASIVNAKTYLSYYLTHENGNDIHNISKIDPQTGQFSNSYKLGHAINEESLVYSNANSPLIAVYLKQESKNDRIVVLMKDSLELVSKFQIPKYNYQTSKKSISFTVFISSDNKKIVIFSGDDKISDINIYDLKSGANLYNKKITGHDFQVSRTKDLNYFVIEYSNLQNRFLRVLDINNLKTSAFKNLGQFPVSTTVFNNTVMISTEKPHSRGTQYKLSEINFKTNEIINHQDISLTPYIFVSNKAENEMFIVGRNTKKKKDLFVLRVTKDNKLVKTNYKKKLNPIDAVLSADNTRLMVVGEDKLATINLVSDTLQSRIRIPFDPLTGIINSNGSIGYVQENNGSQIGNFDLVNGKLIEQSSAGRFLSQVIVNSRKAILNVMIVGLIPSLVETFFSRNNSQKNILLDNDENQLYVINATTNDLSIFDAHTLKKRYAKETGSKTYLMSQGPSKKSPILTIGKDKLNVIDNKNNSILLTLNNAKLIGLDKENDILFYNLNKTLHIYDMKKNIDLSKVSSIDILSIIIY